MCNSEYMKPRLEVIETNIEVLADLWTSGGVSHDDGSATDELGLGLGN